MLHTFLLSTQSIPVALHLSFSPATHLFLPSSIHLFPIHPAITLSLLSTPSPLYSSLSPSTFPHLSPFPLLPSIILHPPIPPSSPLSTSIPRPSIHLFFQTFIHLHSPPILNSSLNHPSIPVSLYHSFCRLSLPSSPSIHPLILLSIHPSLLLFLHASILHLSIQPSFQTSIHTCLHFSLLALTLCPLSIHSLYHLFPPHIHLSTHPSI